MDLLNTLERVYGTDAPAQLDRYSNALEAFRTIYGPGPVSIFRSPGRVNLIGEHTDYNHGFVLPVAIDRDIVLLSRPRDDALVQLHNIEPIFELRSFAISREIPSAAPGDWSNYVRGAAQMVAHNVDGDIRGMDALVTAAPPHGTPRGAGVSSSSALTVVAALATASLNGWSPDPVSFARLCSEAEWYVGTRGGIMDQFIALLGQPGHALYLDCRPADTDAYTVAQVPLPRDYKVLIANTGVRHTNVGGEFNARVAACRAGVACLRAHYPGITHLRDVQDVSWERLEGLLPETMSDAEAQELGADFDNLPHLKPGSTLRVRACCRHVHSENTRVRAACQALEANDTSTVGELLNEAHASARDDYDISCPELEAMVEAALSVDGTAGARLTGAGWGGCVVALVRDDAVTKFKEKVAQEYLARTGREAAIFDSQASGGAGLVGTFTV